MSASWPIGTLTNPHEKALPYLLTAWVVATIPAMVIALALSAILPPEVFERANEVIAPPDLPIAALIFGVVVFAPLAETLIMAIAFAIMAAAKLPNAVQIGFVTVLAGIAHGVQAIAWAPAPTYLFFIFAIVWLTQRQRSWGRAFLFTTIVHTLNNAVAVVPIAVERLT